MTTTDAMPEFDQLADMYWRLGGMQSPSQLHGYLVGQLAVGEAMAAEQWLQQAAIFIDAIEPFNAQEQQLLLALYKATHTQLSAGDMALQLLLPEDAVEITLRTDSLGQWCQGFMAGFAQGGKVIQQAQGQQQYSQDVTEAITDIAAISQIGLGDDDEDAQQREHNLFDLVEYLRLAAITIYLECHQAEAVAATEPPVGSKDQALGSARQLFTKKDKTLH